MILEDVVFHGAVREGQGTCECLGIVGALGAGLVDIGAWV